MKDPYPNRKRKWRCSWSQCSVARVLWESGQMSVSAIARSLHTTRPKIYIHKDREGWNAYGCRRPTIQAQAAEVVSSTVAAYAARFTQEHFALLDDLLLGVTRILDVLKTGAPVPSEDLVRLAGVVKSVQQCRFVETGRPMPINDRAVSVQVGVGFQLGLHPRVLEELALELEQEQNTTAPSGNGLTRDATK